MRSLLTIEADNSPEILERLLRVVRHRGFRVEKLNVVTANNEQHLHATLTVSSEREISLLTKQLDKIFGITKVLSANPASMIKASA